MNILPLLVKTCLALTTLCAVGSANAQGPWFSGLPVHWPTNTPAAGINIGRIAFGKGEFLALGTVSGPSMTGDVALTSQDGLNWALHQVNTNLTQLGAVRALTSSPSNFLAVCAFGTNMAAQLSVDGISWSRPTSVPGTAFFAAIWAEGLYVAVGENGTNSLIVSSPDGVNWTAHTWTNYGGLNAVTWGNGTFVAVGTGGVTFSSTNGLDWTAQLLPIDPAWFPRYLSTVTYGNGVFVASVPGHGGPIFTSSDGLRWEAYLNPTITWWGESEVGPEVWKMAFGEGLFFGICEGGDLGVSADGVNWVGEYLEGGALIPFDDVTYGNGTFVITPPLWVYTMNFDLAVTRTASGTSQVTVNRGTLGQTYRIQGAADVSATNWVDLVTLTNSISPTNWVDVGATNYPRRFYRVVSP